MDKQARTIKRWVKNDDMSLSDMYNKCAEKGWCDYTIESQDLLRDFIVNKISEGIFVAPLLESIENNTAAEYFKVDLSSYSNLPAEPIYTKEEFAGALGYQYKKHGSNF